MKILTKLLTIFCLLILTSCSSYKVDNYTKYQNEISKKQQKLNEDAKDFIAVAKQIIKKNQNKDPELAKAVDILEKGQVLLDSKVSDGDEFKDLTGKELDEAIHKTFIEDKKELISVQELERKDKQLVSEIITDNIKAETIKSYERSKTIKWFAIFGTILSILGGLFYLFPSKFLSVGARILGFFVK